jgi:hypothetical protein
MNEDDVSSIYYKEIDKAKQEGRKQGAVTELEALLNYQYFNDEDEILNKYIRKRLKELKERGV